MKILYRQFLIFTLLVLSFVITAGQTQAQTLAPKSPIKIAMNNWTSQNLLSKITGRIFEKMGYLVEYQVQDPYEQWGALNRGVVHVQVEVWEGTNAKLYNRMIKSGGVVAAGEHDAKTREDWWYPSYMEDVCPGLPDWMALKKCYAIFATEETFPFGRYVAGPWEKPNRARIRALDLKFKEVALKNGNDLREILFAAVNNKLPIVISNWEPNWVEVIFDGKFIEFPEYQPECETDPRWGINSEFLYDCGNPKSGWLKKAAWSGMPEKWPCAFLTLKQINFDNLAISRLAFMVDVEKKTIDDVADHWVETHKPLWQSWIPKDCDYAGTLN
jgi:glycine betaine/proline transport system substrate-binding protein